MSGLYSHCWKSSSYRTDQTKQLNRQYTLYRGAFYMKPIYKVSTLRIILWTYCNLNLPLFILLPQDLFVQSSEFSGSSNLYYKLLELPTTLYIIHFTRSFRSGSADLQNFDENKYMFCSVDLGESDYKSLTALIWKKT